MMTDNMLSVVITSNERKDYFYEEAIKTLRTNLQFCGNSVHTIMLTSSVPGEGKSTTSFSVARSIAQIGKKVLFIDADIRKSMFTTRLTLDHDVDGLSQYLSGQKKLDEVVYRTNIDNLYMVFAGPYAPNPAELLEEKLFEQLLEYGKENFDYIIIDSPPMASLIDGAIIAKLCDGAAIVVESGGVSYRLIQRVKQQLEKSECRILGVILNKMPMEQNGYYKKYYGKYGKYSKYGHYGHYDQYSNAYKQE